MRGPWTLALLAPLSAACSEDFAPAVDAAEVAMIRVEPAFIDLVTGPDGGDTFQFEAWATYGDGTEARLPEAEWTLSNRSTGDIDETGFFEPSTTNGGISYVTARFASAQSQATLTLVYQEELVEEGADPSVFSERGLRADPADTLWTYPEDGVNVPRNTPSIQFQWAAAKESEGYRLRFSSTVTDLTVYTLETSWTADEETWQRIGSTNAGGEVQVELSAKIPVGTVSEAPRTVQINRMDADGSIFYWSTSASGIMEIPYGGSAEEFLTPNTAAYSGESSTQCYACHVVSPRGLISFTYDGGNGRLGVKDMDDLSDVIAYWDNVYANFKTFSPDGRYMLGTFGGALSLYDGETGEYLHEVAVDGSATHVDWSPDGSQVVLALTDDHYADWYFTGGRIAVMDHLGDGQFGEPRVLYRPDSGIAYYPAFSPDGDWIAFNVSTGDAYDDEDALVAVMSSTGDAPIMLDAANMGEGLTNSWPRWGPLPDDDVLWLAFASKRTYGNITSGNPQIWVAGFDPERAREGEDPSWPAFWLPGQDSAQNNHIPVWAD